MSSVADQALLAAHRGWSGVADDRFWQCFAPAWREALRTGWDQASRLGPEESRERLRREHESHARPDLSRVHPSWWLRALKDETPAVQRAVVAAAPRSIREALRTGLGLSEDDLRPDRPPMPEALRGAAALWTERLVGDSPDRDDPPVIVALTRLDHTEVSRLIHLVGLAKWAASGLEGPVLKENDRRVLESLRGPSAPRDANAREQAIRDVAEHGQVGRHAEASLGLLTFARLLDVAEPYRVRWALQHVPYGLARFVRTLMKPRLRHDPSLVPWETELLAAARDILREEGPRSPSAGGEP